MKKFFTLTAFAAALATQIASANVTYGSVFPVDFAYGVPTGWALPSNNADAQTQTVDDGLQITCNQTAAKYRTDIKYNMFGDYNGNTDIWIDFDASKYKVFAIKFIGERPKSGCLKLSNISVSKSWIKGSEGYSLSEQGWKDLTDADGNHTYYWTVGGDNWTGTLSIDRIEIVIADITDDADKTFTVSSMNWYQSVEELEASLTLQQETAVVNETTKKGYADFTSAWKDAADGAVLLVNEDQEVSERLNSDSRSITVKGATKDTKITRKKAGNMLFLSNSKDCTLTLEDITLDGNGDESDRNFIEASSNGKVVYNNVLISNANSTNGVGLVVAKNSGKVAMNGLSFENCTTNNDAVEVFIGAHGSTISGNNNVKISIEDNSNAYALTVDGELTNTTPIKLTPYSKEDNNFTEDYPLVKGTTDASKFVLNTADTQTLVADEENNLLVVHTSTSGVESLVEDDMNVAPVYYNVNGMRVEQPTAGLYIVRRGNTVTKEIVK